MICRAAISPSYDGPVPIVTHLHGQRNAFDFADGYSEAWYMPATPNRLAGPAGQRFAQVSHSEGLQPGLWLFASWGCRRMSISIYVLSVFEPAPLYRNNAEADFVL